MQIIKDKNKECIEMPLCDVPVGWIFTFKRGDKTPMLRLSDSCGYCELGTAWHSVEELDFDSIDINGEIVSVHGKLSAISVI